MPRAAKNAGKIRHRQDGCQAGASITQPAPARRISGYKGTVFGRAHFLLFSIINILEKFFTSRGSNYTW